MTVYGTSRLHGVNKNGKTFRKQNQKQKRKWKTKWKQKRDFILILIFLFFFILFLFFIFVFVFIFIFVFVFVFVFIFVFVFTFVFILFFWFLFSNFTMAPLGHHSTLMQIWKPPICLCSYENNTLKILHSQSYEFSSYKRSHPEVFWRNAVVKICSKFTAEHPIVACSCRSTISI